MRVTDEEYPEYPDLDDDDPYGLQVEYRMGAFDDDELEEDAD